MPGYSPRVEGMNEPAESFTPCDHLVQVYRDRHELADSVALFLGSGLTAGEAAVAVASAAHWPDIAQRLEGRGWDAGVLERSGRLVRADAESTLEAICEDGTPSLRRFTPVVGGLLDRAAGEPARRVRVFGEMVDILCRRGQAAAADSLEGMWNRLAGGRRFTLLCGYRVELFDVDAQVNLLPRIYHAHSRVLPPNDPARLERALDDALVQVLGDADARKVHGHVARQERDDRVPSAQLALMWISAHMPVTAERILDAARANYLNAAGATPLPSR